MSSQFRDSSPRFSPPQSAQPFRSLFGGPSSQDVDLEPYPESPPGADVEQDRDEFDAIMGDVPMVDDNQSDVTYHASDEDESEPDFTTRVKKKHKHQTTRDKPISPPSSPVYRSNRFRGPDSTWRKLTAEERQNAQALETIRARDLTAHLYNSYALRVRGRERGRRTARRDEQLDELQTFVPPKRWTAWPMPADEVPRAEERLRKAEDDAWTLRMPPDPRDSADLEESVMAIMLKTAKDRFGAREWERTRAVPRSREPSASQFDNDDERESTSYEGDVKSDPEFVDGAELHPVVQADDDKSRRQLRPISRNILTQFDRLLMGLHHAQIGGAAGDSSGSEGQTDTESIASGTSSPRKRGRSNAAARSQSRGRKRTRRSSHSTKSTNSRSRSARPSARSHTRRGPGHRGRSRGQSADRLRQGLRDWSEVLGIAAMVGWPPAVVMRAAKRCSSLFGEDMAFQKFHEGKVEKVKESEEEHVRYIERESEPEPDSPPPSPSSSRPSRSHSRAASIKRETTSGRASPANSAVSSGKGKGQHRKQDLVCPLKSCPRHKNGFSRTWNLNLHMKRVHPNYRPRDNSRTPIKIDE